MAVLTKYFSPQPDITAYELAYMAGRVEFQKARKSGCRFSQKDWDKLTPEIKRHWTDEQPE